MHTSETLPATTATSSHFAHGGLPAFMLAALNEACCGGSSGYEVAGFTLGRHFADQCPNGAELDEWEAELDRLDTFIDDDNELARWLRQTYPRIMAKVPSRRIGQFIAGVRRAHEEGLTGF